MGGFPELTAVLRGLGESNIKIDAAYIMSVGCIRLLGFDDPKLSFRYPVAEYEKLSALATDKKVGEVHAEILRALQSQPNVFNIATVKKRQLEYMNHSGLGLLVVGDLFSLKVRLPERLRKFRGPWAEDTVPGEEFDVFSSGSLFAAIGSIRDYPTRTNIGHEYRELLKEQIEKHTAFKCPAIGPSPIHPKFYVVCRQKGDGQTSEGVRNYVFRGDELVVLDGGLMSGRDLVADLFQRLERPLFEFYDLQLDRLNLINFEIEIGNRFGDVASHVKQLLATPWWHFFKRGKFSSSARTSLSEIHNRLVEYESALLYADRSRSEYLKHLKEDALLGQIDEYFASMSEEEVRPAKSLVPALNYFVQELQAFGSMRSVTLASFLSAFAGALFYALVSRLLK